jgi:hypothetical protein
MEYKDTKFFSYMIDFEIKIHYKNEYNLIKKAADLAALM